MKRLVSAILALCLLMVSGTALAASKKVTYMEQDPAVEALMRREAARYVPPQEWTEPEYTERRGDELHFRDERGVDCYIPYRSDYYVMPTIRAKATGAGSRTLINTYSMSLPENGMYYEKLYSTKATSAKERVAWMTDAWAKASKYTASKNHTTNWSHTGDISITVKKIFTGKYSLNYSVTNTASYSLDIPADSKRYSKLALFNDFVTGDLAFQELVVRNNATVRNDWTYGKTKNPKDKYLNVVYQ